MPTTSFECPCRHSCHHIGLAPIASPPYPPICVFSSPNAHFLPNLCLFECNHSSPASIDSNRARMLTFRLRRVYSSVIACLPPPSQFESERLFPISTMLIEARSLVSHLHRLKVSPNARFPLLLCPFECNCSSPASSVSIRTGTLVSYLHHVDSSPNTRFSSRPCLFKLSRSSPTSTINLSANVRTSTRFPATPCSFERKRKSAHLDMSSRA